MSESVTDTTKKVPIVGNILNWVLGAFATAVSVMYLDQRSDKEFLRKQLDSANERAAKAEQREIDCHNLRATRAENASEAAKRIYLEENPKK